MRLLAFLRRFRKRPATCEVTDCFATGRGVWREIGPDWLEWVPHDGSQWRRLAEGCAFTSRDGVIWTALCGPCARHSIP